MIKSLMKKIIPARYWEDPNSFYYLYLKSHACTYYSQEGEDILLRRIFGDQTTGFYVDVGAHHPKRFSNTCYFYDQGWQGINIDALPGSMEVFQKVRPRDTNLEIAISEKEQNLTYYMFNEPALNGFSKSISEGRQNEQYHIEKTITIPTFPLSKILDTHLPSRQKINFLSVDVEGLDLTVLASNDWTKYRPKVVLAEVLDSSLNNLEKDPVYNFMATQGYTLFAKLFHTCIFKIEE
jgi:FkbM family methyltransferase|tara:strand:+ start:1491 stop:2201 length:711 start_codon:yes stop_codon:yes gene_type:complete